MEENGASVSFCTPRALFVNTRFVLNAVPPAFQFDISHALLLMLRAGGLSQRQVSGFNGAANSLKVVAGQFRNLF